MTDINEFALTGRIAGETKLGTTKNGTATLSFCLAVNRDKYVNNQWVNNAGFYWFTVYGNRATGLYKYLKKGRALGVSGHVEQDVWQDGEKKNYRTVLYPEKIAPLGSSEKVTAMTVQENTAETQLNEQYANIPENSEDNVFYEEGIPPEIPPEGQQPEFDNNGIF